MKNKNKRKKAQAKANQAQSKVTSPTRVSALGFPADNRWVVAGSLAIIGVLGLLCYSNSYTASYHFDDAHTILLNPYIKNFSSLRQLWDFGPSRILVGISFALNYYFGGLRVFGYHLVNNIIHLASAFFVFWLTRMLVARTRQANPAGYRWLPLLASALFVAHPIQTQAVTYFAQRYTSMAAFFYLLSLCLYVKGATQSAGKPKRWFLGAFVTGIAAMFCKEISVTLPAAILLIEYLILSPDKLSFRRNSYRTLPFLALFLVIPVTVFSTWGHTVLNESAIPLDPEWRHPRLSYVFTQANVVRTYLRLLVLPYGQNLDYDFPISHSLLNIPTLFSALLHLGLLVFAFRSRRKMPLVSLGILFFYLCLSVESSILPIQDVIFEHRVYLPSAGFLITSGALLLMLLDKSRQLAFARHQHAAVDQPAMVNGDGPVAADGHSGKSFLLPWTPALVGGMIPAIVFILALATHERNKVWQNENTLWHDVVAKSPKKPRAHHNLGKAYENAGMLDAAKKKFDTVLGLDTNYFLTYNSLGNVHFKKGNIDAAVKHYERAIRLKRKFVRPYVNLIRGYTEQGHDQKAKMAYRAAISINPNFPDVHFEMGNLYARKGNLDSAALCFAKASRMDPYSVRHAFNLALSYQNKGMILQAEQQFLKVREMDPTHAGAHAGLAMVYEEKGQFEEATRFYNRATELDPTDHKPAYNLALLYRRRGMVQEAISQYRKVISINPQFAGTYYNLGAEFEKTGMSDSAKASYEKALELDPKMAKAHNNLGAIYERRGDRKRAAREYSAALKIDPGLTLTRQNLARVSRPVN